MDDPVLAELDVGDVAFLEIDDLIGDAGERHRVGSEEGLARAGADARTEDQRRALARADHAVRLVTAEHGDGEGTAQPGHGTLHRLEQVAVVVAVDEVGDDFGVGLGDEVVAGGLQLGAQLVVVLDDPVVHQADPAGGGDARGFARIGDRDARPVREVGMGVVHHRRAVRRPAGVGDAGAAMQVIGLHVRRELGHARRAARPAQLAVLVQGDAARVVAAVLEAAQAFDQDRNDVSRADGSDDSAHGWDP